MPAHFGYRHWGGDLFLWDYQGGQGAAPPVNISALATASLGAGSDDWFALSWNGEWIILQAERAEGVGWAALFIASMATYPASLDFHVVRVGEWPYNSSVLHSVANDGLSIYGAYDSDAGQVTRFSRPNISGTTFTPTTIYVGTAGYNQVRLSLDESRVVFSVGANIWQALTAAPYTATQLLNINNVALSDAAYPSFMSDGRLIFEGNGGGGDEGIYRLDTIAPNESYTDISGAIGNDNAPFCVAVDGDRVASLYLSRAGNSNSSHELLFRDADGANPFAPTQFYGVELSSGVFTAGDIAVAGATDVANDLDLRWGTLNGVAGDLSLGWAALNAVVGDIDAAWDMLNAVTQSGALPWDIRQAAQSDAQVVFDVLNNATADSTLSWHLLAAITDDADLRWDMRQNVEQDRSVRWDIASALAGVSADLPAHWDLLQAIQATLENRWDIRAEAFNDAQMLWSLVTHATGDLELAWGLVQNLVADMESSWSVTQNIQQDVGLAWDINSALQTVSADLGVTWGLRRAIVATLDSRWSLLQVINADAQLRWDVANSLISEIGLLHSLRQNISVDADLRWDAIGITENSISFHWSVGDLSLSSISFIRIHPEPRVFRAHTKGAEHGYTLN